jgi:hypothetical protein
VSGAGRGGAERVDAPFGVSAEGGSVIGTIVDVLLDGAVPMRTNPPSAASAWRSRTPDTGHPGRPTVRQAGDHGDESAQTRVVARMNAMT